MKSLYRTSHIFATVSVLGSLLSLGCGAAAPGGDEAGSGDAQQNDLRGLRRLHTHRSTTGAAVAAGGAAAAGASAGGAATAGGAVTAGASAGGAATAGGSASATAGGSAGDVATAGGNATAGGSVSGGPIGGGAASTGGSASANASDTPLSNRSLDEVIAAAQTPDGRAIPQEAGPDGVCPEVLIRLGFWSCFNLSSQCSYVASGTRHDCTCSMTSGEGQLPSWACSP